MSSVPATVKPAGELRISVLRRAADYWTLTKPEVNFLVLISALAGFYAASRGPLDWALLAHTLVGTLLVASGTATLNQLMEREPDARMRRTALRPLPAGRMPAMHALGFGMLLSIAGGGLGVLAALWGTSLVETAGANEAGYATASVHALTGILDGDGKGGQTVRKVYAVYNRL